jgi:L-ribulokinase
MIVETFNDAGVPVREFIAVGGLLRNARLMQTYSDVLRAAVSVIGSEHGPALGAAIHAAVAAGVYRDVRGASQAMGKLRREVYVPDPAAADVYDALYAEYKTLHEYFGRACDPGANQVMHRLKRMRREVLYDRGGFGDRDRP